MIESVEVPWSTRVIESLHDSIGDIVFGMEDGTVSIFGLVVGVAASAPDAHVVLVAGATGAIAAAVSMMAGTYLDVESENDRRNAAIEQRRLALVGDPSAELVAQRSRLTRAGFAEDEIETITSILERHPDTVSVLDAAFELGIAPTDAGRPAVRAAWMFVADLFAAFTPVLPFAWFNLATARIVSLTVTAVLLVILGVGRARLGHRSLIATTVETITIAAGAAGAGILISQLIA
jgi:VIT1/CCC1 family predicted Fe2+/Mn2+ transporter